MLQPYETYLGYIQYNFSCTLKIWCDEIIKKSAVNSIYCIQAEAMIGTQRNFSMVWSMLYKFHLTGILDYTLQ